MILINILTVFSALSFLFYGISCLLTPHMISEFERFGLAGQRRLTGLLQILGGLALLVGWYFDNYILAAIAAGGLTILMILGVGVRIKIKDSLAVSLPAILYVLINFYLFLYFAKFL
jgi:hypothetical protein